MDSRQLENIIKIAEEQNITRAAEKLFLSQSALNQQLLKLENELGTQLFNRVQNSCILTEAGEIYIRMARQILALKQEAYAQISDVAEIKREKLAVGITPGKGDALMAWLYKHFYAAYPQVKLEIHQAVSPQLQKEITSGALDLAILTVGLETLPAGLTIQELRREELLLVMRKDDPLAQTAVDEGGTPVLDLQNFKDEPFSLGNRNSSNSAILMDTFQSAGIAPDIHYEFPGLRLRMAMAEMSLYYIFVEEHYRTQLPESLTAFRLTAHPSFRWVAVSREGKYLSHAAREFIALAKAYWENYEF